MKLFVVLCVAFVALQASSAQVIRSLGPNIIGGLNSCGCSGPILAPSPIIAPMPACPSPIIAPAVPSVLPVYPPPTVAARLADTLSLLTVSSLLSEALPLAPNMVVPACGGYYL